MPSNETAPLFAAARRFGIGFHLGYAELVQEADETGAMRARRFNTAILVSPAGDILLKYRKVHLPGHAEYAPHRARAASGEALFRGRQSRLPGDPRADGRLWTA